MTCSLSLYSVWIFEYLYDSELPRKNRGNRSIESRVKEFLRIVESKLLLLLNDSKSLSKVYPFHPLLDI